MTLLMENAQHGETPDRRKEVYKARRSFSTKNSNEAELENRKTGG